MDFLLENDEDAPTSSLSPPRQLIQTHALFSQRACICVCLCPCASVQTPWRTQVKIELVHVLCQEEEKGGTREGENEEESQRE